MLAIKERSLLSATKPSSRCTANFQRMVCSPHLFHLLVESHAPFYIVHYSFDMAHQIHYPANPFQPGPIYFLTPRKCAIFGVCCEAIPRQINYLIDEASDTGKGSNTIVSLLHHFFQVHGLGEREVHLHADNCVGQNKNNTMLQYLLWCTNVGLDDKITLSFLVVGHTKFSPDWCFGLLKQRLQRANVGSLGDIAEVVNNSANAKHCPEAVHDKVCPKPLVALNTALQQHDSTTLTSMATNSTDHL